jgi:hypothetical protein
MLPKFLIADNSQEQLGKIYVVHTQSPRFILEGDEEDFANNQVIYWLDNTPNQDKEKQLRLEAEQFLDSELDNQEDLYDEME